MTDNEILRPQPPAGITDWLKQRDAGQREALRQAAVVAGSRDADEYGNALRLAADIGKPVDVALRALRGAQAGGRELTAGPINKYDDLYARHPGLAEWAIDPANATISKDDMEALGRMYAVTARRPGNMLLGLDRAFESGVDRLALSAPITQVAHGLMDERQAAEMIAAGLRSLTASTSQEPAYARRVRRAMEPGSELAAEGMRDIVQAIEEASELDPEFAGRGIVGVLKAASGTARMLADPFFDDIVAFAPGMAYLLTEQLPTSFPALAYGAAGAARFGPLGLSGGVFVGGAPVEFSDWFTQRLYERVADPTDPNQVEEALRDKDWMAVVSAEARRKALGTAGLDALTAFAAGRFLSTAVGGKAKAAAGARELARETVSEAAGEALGQAAATGDIKQVDWQGAVQEGLLAFGQSAGTVGIGVLARRGATLDAEGRVIPPGLELGSEVGPEGQAIAGAVASAQQAVVDAEALTEAGEAWSESKAARRSPERLRAMLDIAAGEGGVDAVRIAKEAVDAFYGQRGEMPAQAVAAWWDGGAEAYRDAASTLQVEVPPGVWVEKIGATELLDGLLPHSRVRGDESAMSLADAAERTTEIATALEAVAEESQELFQEGAALQAEDAALAAEEAAAQPEAAPAAAPAEMPVEEAAAIHRKAIETLQALAAEPGATEAARRNAELEIAQRQEILRRIEAGEVTPAEAAQPTPTAPGSVEAVEAAPVPRPEVERRTLPRPTADEIRASIPIWAARAEASRAAGDAEDAAYAASVAAQQTEALAREEARAGQPEAEPQAAPAPAPAGTPGRLAEIRARRERIRTRLAEIAAAPAQRADEGTALLAEVLPQIREASKGVMKPREADLAARLLVRMYQTVSERYGMGLRKMWTRFPMTFVREKAGARRVAAAAAGVPLGAMAAPGKAGLVPMPPAAPAAPSAAVPAGGAPTVQAMLVGAAPAPVAPAATPREPIAMAEGRATTIHTIGATYPARFAVVELSDIIPSHRTRRTAAGGRTFTPDPRYPAGLQPRKYEAREEEQAKVERFATDLPNKVALFLGDSATVTDGPPVVTKDGVVINGNGRAMALGIAAQGNAYEAYRAQLLADASRYGVAREAAAAMQQPVLVRVVDMPADSEQAAIFAREGNEALTQAQSTGDRMQALAGVMPPETLFINVPEDSTLPEVLSGGSKQARALLRRIYDALPENIRPAFFTEPDILSDAGKEAVSKLLLGSVITPEIVEKQRPAIRAMLTKAIPQLAAMQVELLPALNLRAALEGALEYGAEFLNDWSQPVGQGFLGGADPFGSLSPEQQGLVRYISDNVRSDVALRKLLAQYVVFARGSTMMGQASVSPLEALAGALLSLQRARQDARVEEAPNEYQQDLFGRPLPVTTGLRPPEPAGGREAEPVSEGLAGTPVTSTQTHLVSDQSRKVPSGKVTTPSEAAEFFAYLGDRTEEHFEALVTDAQGRPLGITGGFKGGVAEAHVPPAAVLGEAFKLPGAANLWLAHNHPSGDAGLSPQDRALEARYFNLFRGTNIAMRGILAIGGPRDGGRTWSFATTDAAVPSAGGITAGRKPARRVNLVERRFTVYEKAGPKVTGVDQGIEAWRTLAPGRSGIILLDSKMHSLGFIPLTGEESIRLRAAGRMDAIYRALADAPTRGSIITDGGDLGNLGIRNVAGMLNALNIAPVDVLQSGPGGTVSSWARRGRAMPSETEFYQTDPGPRLSALHNLSAANLKHADEVGGLAMPSLAVVPEAMPMTEKMGEITLIGGRALADPSTVPVFDADIYSPRWPMAEYGQPDVAAWRGFLERLAYFGRKFGEPEAMPRADVAATERPSPAGVIASLVNSYAAKAMFLDEQMVGVVPVRRRIEAQELTPAAASPAVQSWLASEGAAFSAARHGDPVWTRFSEAVRQGLREWVGSLNETHPEMREELLAVHSESIFDQNGMVHFGVGDRIVRGARRLGQEVIAEGDTHAAIDKALRGREAAFKEWLDAQIVPMFGSPYLTVGGRRVPYTLSNIVERMRQETLLGGEQTMTFGEGKARAVSARQFSDITHMRNAAYNIKPEGEVDALREKAKKALEAWRGRVIEHHGSVHPITGRGVDTWRALDSSMRAMARWAKSGMRRGFTTAALSKALSAEGFRNVPKSVLEDGVDAGKLWLDAPVPYFEAKPERAVELSEFTGAVVPASAAQETRDILSKHNIAVAEYGPRDGDRQRAISALRGALAERGGEELFQTAYHGSGRRDIQRMSTEYIGTGEGAQAYGWGLYFASSRAVAKYYRDVLTRGGGRIRLSQQPGAANRLHDIAMYVLTGGDPTGRGRAQANDDWQRYHYRATSNASAAAGAFKAPTTDNIVGRLRELLEQQKADERRYANAAEYDAVDHNDALIDVAMTEIAIQALTEGVYVDDGAKGGLYTVELAPAEDDYLLWDKPLAEQSEKVKAALRGMLRIERQSGGAYRPDGAAFVMLGGHPLVTAPLETSDEELMRLGVVGLEGRPPEPWSVTEHAGRWWSTAPSGARINAFDTQAEAEASARQHEGIVMRSRRVNGAEFYRQLVESPIRGVTSEEIEATGRSREELASKALLAAGIPGIKYLDQQSRGTSGGTLIAVEVDGGKFRAKIKVPNRDGTDIFTTSRPYDTRAEAEAWAQEQIAGGSFNYVIFDDSLVTITELEQAEQGDAPGRPPRGGMRIGGKDASGRRPFTLVFYEGANRSTFFHEVGHAFLQVVEDLAAEADAPQQLKDDYAGALSYLGATSAASLTTEQKETWARSFEGYLMEGKAPSPEVRSLFASLRQWLVGIYKELLALDVRLTDDVRAIMDRLVATDAEIAAAEYESGASTPTPDEALGDQAEAVRTKRQRAMDAGREKLGRQLLAAVKKETQEAMRDKIAAEMPAALEAVSQRQEVKMVDSLKAGPGINKEGLVEAGVPSKTIRRLEAMGVLSATGGAPQAVAEAWGYRSISEMVKAALVGGAKELMAYSHAKAAAMKANPDLAASQAGLRRESRKAANGLERSAAIHAEYVALRGQVRTQERALERAGPAAVRAEGAKRRQAFDAVETIDQIAAEARAVLRGKALRDIRPSAYLASARRESNLSAKRARVGDWEGAARSKRAELLNHELYRAAMRGMERARSDHAFLVRMNEDGAQAVFGKAGRTWIDQANAILDRFSLKTVSRPQVERLAALADWATSVEQQTGVLPNFNRKLLDESFKKNWQDLTLAELRMVRDSVEQIYELARGINMFLMHERHETMAELEAEVVPNIMASRPPMPRVLGSETPQQRVQRNVADILEGGTKANAWIIEMDRFKDGGPLWGATVRKLNTGSDREAARAPKELERYRVLDEKHLTKEERRHRNRLGKVAGRDMSLQDRLSVAGHWGNVEGRQRLLFTFTPDEIRAILSSLTAEHLKLVQERWRYFDSFWDEIVEQELRVTGGKPEKVVSVPFSVRTADGQIVQLGGGYHPIKYKDRRSFTEELTEWARDTVRGGPTRRMMDTGYTIAREEKVYRPLDLSRSVETRHIADVVHSLSLREAVIDVRRVLSHRPIRDAIASRYGDAAIKSLERWVTIVAAGPRPTQDGLERTVGYLRYGTVVARLGFRLKVGLIQLTGLRTAIVKVGAPWLWKGVHAWFKDAESIVAMPQAVMDKSSYMGHRLTGTWQRELNELRYNVDDRLRTGMSEAAFWFVSRMQFAVDLVTWLGAYEKAKATADAKGLDLEQAEALYVAIADQAVKDSQGGGMAVDQSWWEAGNPLLRVLTTFYTDAGIKFNLTSTSWRRTKFSDPMSFAHFLSDMGLLYLFLPVIGYAIGAAVGGDDDEPEKAAKEVGKRVAAEFLDVWPILRDVSGSIRGYDYRGSAGSLFQSELARTIEQAGQAEVDAALWRSVNMLTGTVLHYPAAAINEYAEAIVQVLEGEAPTALVGIRGGR